MTNSISTALVTSKNEQNKTTPLVWLASIQTGASSSWNLARYLTNITTYEGDSAPYTATTYYSFPWEFNAIRSDQQGTLTELELKVSNVTRELVSVLEADDITGYLVRLRLADTGALGDASNATAFMVSNKYYILDIPEIDNRNVVFQVGHYSLLRKRAPSQVFNRNRCAFRFGSAECGFPSGASGSFTGSKDGFDLSQVSVSTCDLGYSTPNGCKAHGAFAKASGIPNLWPRRFRGFPGIVKGPGY